MITSELRELAHFAYLTALKAGTLLLKMRNDHLQVSKKEDNSLVSDADTAASDFLLGRFSREFPNFAILNEESVESGDRMHTRYCWVIDPLDNTAGFLAGDDNFGVLIGLLDNYAPVLGVAARPMREEVYWTVKGEVTHLVRPNSSCDVNVRHSLARDVVASYSRVSPDLRDILDRIQPNTVVHKGGSLKIADVADGTATAFVNAASNRMHLWDTCALEIIANNAGATVTNLRGETIDYSSASTVLPHGLLVTNGTLHNPLLQAIDYRGYTNSRPRTRIDDGC